jgi:hypothetical protein
MSKTKKVILAAAAAAFLTAAVLVFLYLWPRYDLSGQIFVPGFTDETLLLVGSSFLGDGVNHPLMLFINTRDWSIKTLDLNTFPNINATGITETVPFLLNGEQKWAVTTHHPGKLLIMGIAPPEQEAINSSQESETDAGFAASHITTNLSSHGLQIEFEEEIDEFVLAVFVGDITGEGKEEIVVGTRPNGILKYYAFADGRWSGTTIDKLGIGKFGAAINDLLIADLDENGLNEIVLTTHIPLHQFREEDTEFPPFDPKILQYKLDQELGTWSKNVIWSYTATEPLSWVQKLLYPNVRTDEYYPYPRYLFFDNVDGDGEKEIVTNQLGIIQSIVLLKRQKIKGRKSAQSWRKEIIESELSLDPRVIAVGDITNDGKSDIIAPTKPNDALMLYKQEVKWRRSIVDRDLVGEDPPPTDEESGEERVQAVAIVNAPKGKYKKILYVVSSPKGKAARFYLLSYEIRKDAWEKELVAELPIGIQAWHIGPAFSPPYQGLTLTPKT